MAGYLKYYRFRFDAVGYFYCDPCPNSYRERDLCIYCSSLFLLFFLWFAAIGYSFSCHANLLLVIPTKEGSLYLLILFRFIFFKIPPSSG